MKNKNKGIGVILTVMMLIAVMLCGCTPTITGKITGKAAEQDNIKIGVIAPFTGPVGKYGQSTANGLEIALEEINSDGGVNGRQIQLIYEDTQYEGKQAVSAFNKLVDFDDVSAMIVFSSVETLAVCPIAEEREILMLSNGASADEVSECGDFTFRMYPKDGFQSKKMVETAIEKGFKRVALVHLNDDYGAGIKKKVIEETKKHGLDLVSIESINPEDRDMRTLVTKVKIKDPDVVFVASALPQSGYVIKQAREIGLDVPFIASESSKDNEMFEVAGEAAEGLLVTHVKENQDEFAQSFKQKFEAKHGKESFSLYADYAYDGLYVLKHAMEKSDLSRKGIRDAMPSIELKGATWTTKFDENGDVSKPQGLFKVENQQFIEVR